VLVAIGVEFSSVPLLPTQTHNEPFQSISFPVSIKFNEFSTKNHLMPSTL